MLPDMKRIKIEVPDQVYRSAHLAVAKGEVSSISEFFLNPITNQQEPDWAEFRDIANKIAKESDVTDDSLRWARESIGLDTPALLPA